MMKIFWALDNCLPRKFDRKIKIVKLLLLMNMCNVFLCGIGILSFNIHTVWDFVDYSNTTQYTVFVILHNVFITVMYSIAHLHKMMYLYYCMHINIQMEILTYYFKTVSKYVFDRNLDETHSLYHMKIVIKQHFNIHR